MENNKIINNTNLSQMSTEDLLKETGVLLKELESREYIVSFPKKPISKVSLTSPKTQKPIHLNIDCKKIFNEKTQQELEILLKGYTKSEINELYNQVSTIKGIKLSGSKSDYIDSIIRLKRAKGACKSFAKW